MTAAQGAEGTIGKGQGTVKENLYSGELVWSTTENRLLSAAYTTGYVISFDIAKIKGDQRSARSLGLPASMHPALPRPSERARRAVHPPRICAASSFRSSARRYCLRTTVPSISPRNVNRNPASSSGCSTCHGCLSHRRDNRRDERDDSDHGLIPA